MDVTSGFTGNAIALPAEQLAAEAASEALRLQDAKERQVNRMAKGDQQFPAIAALADGGYIVVWMSLGQDGDGHGIFGQRFDKAGEPAGDEFQVNTAVKGDQADPAVTALARGGFVVSWTSPGQDGDAGGVFAQRFDENGKPLGEEFQANDIAKGDQRDSRLAMLPDGGFLVAWSTPFADGEGLGIVARRYDADGRALDAEFRVNDSPAGDQVHPALTTLASGGFVVSWVSAAEQPELRGVFAQAFDADGKALGKEIRVDEIGGAEPSAPALAALADGGFLVAWTATEEDGKSLGIFALRFDEAGVAHGKPFLVNAATEGDQAAPSVAPTADGGYLVTWMSYATDGDGFGVFARRFDKGDQPVGKDVQVNATAEGEQQYPAVASLADGSLVVGWMADRLDGDGWGIFARSISLEAGNHAPTAAVAIAAQSSPEDTAWTFTLPADSFADADGDALAWSAGLADGGTLPAWLQFTPATRIFSGTPPLDFTGSIAITVTASDGSLSASQDFTLTVLPVNDAPGGTDGTVSGSEDQAYVFALADFGFVDGDGNALLAVNVASLPGKGSLLFDADGPGGAVPVTVTANQSIAASDVAAVRFSFQPAPDATGSPYTSFTFRLRDDGGTADGGVDLDPTPNTLAIAIQPANDAPGAADDRLAATEDVAVQIAAAKLLGNDSDPDLDTLVIDQVSNPLGGTVKLNPDGSVTFTPSANFNGAGGFDYRLSDGHGGHAAAHVVVDVLAVNDAPSLAASQRVETLEDTAVSVTIAATDVDGDALSRAVVTAPEHGRLSATTGGYSYQPAKDFAGADSFVVRVSDGKGGTASQTVSVKVLPVNDAPVVTSFGGSESVAVTVAENGSKVLAVTASDIDGDRLDYAISGGADAALFTVDPASGALSFKAAPDFEAPGDADGDNVYRVEVSAGDGALADVQRYSVAVANVNEAPVVDGAIAIVVDEDTPSPAVAVAASDPDGDALSYSLSTEPAQASVSLSGGAFVYVPAPDFHGTDSFAITVADGKGAFARQDVTVTVRPVNDAPVAGQDAITLAGSAPTVLAPASLLANDRDADGDTLEIVAIANASHVTVAIRGSLIDIAPEPGFSGEAGFDYTVSDGNGGSAVGHVVVTLGTTEATPEEPPADNHAPTVPSGQALVTLVDTAIALGVAALDPDGDPLAFAAAGALHGSVTDLGGGAFAYTPDQGYTGADSFVVTVEDDGGATAQQVVAVTVAGRSAPDDWQLFANDGFGGQVGGSGEVFGTAGFQRIEILDRAGTIVLDPSFNRGGDLVVLPGTAAHWRVARDGSSAVLSDGDTLVQLAVGTAGTAIEFDDGTRLLKYDAGLASMTIGAQAFATMLVPVSAARDGTPAAEADAGGSGRLLVAAGGSAEASGNLAIFGSAAAEDVTLGAGQFRFDPSFNKGGDRIVVAVEAAAFSAVRQGSSLFLDSAGTDLVIPVGTRGMTIEFAGGDERLLLFDTALGSMRIGDQLVGGTHVALTAFG